jgi:hypothetical protein
MENSTGPPPGNPIKVTPEGDTFLRPRLWEYINGTTFRGRHKGDPNREVTRREEIQGKRFKRQTRGPSSGNNSY